MLKSEHIVLGKNRTMNILVEGRAEAKKVKLLGLTFDNNYKFTDHITNVNNKIASRIGQISKIVNVASISTSKELANAICVSVAAYACEIYATDAALRNKVQVKLNIIMQILTNAGNRTPIKIMLSRLEWMTFDQLIKYTKIMLLYKQVIYYVSPYCKILIHRGVAKINARYEIRERELRIAWRPKTVKTGERSYLLSATVLYNAAKLFGKVIPREELKENVKTKVKLWR